MPRHLRDQCEGIGDTIVQLNARARGPILSASSWSIRSIPERRRGTQTGGHQNQTIPTTGSGRAADRNAMPPFQMDAQSADRTALRPFRVDVPEAELTELRRRIQATKFPERETVPDATQGVQLATVEKLARYWGTEYDWR